jgi:hypothetical protein
MSAPHEPATIDWDYPEPRPGFAGQIDRLNGPGATKAESLLGWAAAFLAGGGVLAYALVMDLGWSPLQLILAVFLAFDLAGGVFVNATSAAKRWYHRQGQGFMQHFAFVALHAVQLGMVAFLFRPNDWAYFLVNYGFLLLSTTLILALPLYLRRPMALIVLCDTFLINAYLFDLTPGLEWFLPVFFLKLLVAHILREEPYRPTYVRTTTD